MIIKEKIEKAINKQINRELYSGYIYLAMSAYFESINLKGFAHWMRKQAEEEYEHAMRFYNYVVERGGRVKMGEIEAPQVEWKSPRDAFQHTYGHENIVTKMINNLVKISREENDYATEEMLQWFVKEQVEEEDSASEILEKLKMIKDSKNGLLMLDHELSKRE